MVPAAEQGYQYLYQVKLDRPDVFRSQSLARLADPKT